MIKQSALIAAGTVLGTTALGCSSSTEPAPSAAPTPSNEPSAAAGSSRILLVYFSRPGENYYYGDRIDLEIGNTEVMSGMIADAVELDTFRIEAADPYPAGYEATVDRNRQEQNDDARPAISGTLPITDGYDTILIGSPIWGSQTPMIMRTFTDGVDLGGKTIFPFVTYAVSGLGDTVDEYRELCPQATIGEGLAVQGEEVQDARDAVTSWLRNFGLV